MVSLIPHTLNVMDRHTSEVHSVYLSSMENLSKIILVSDNSPSDKLDNR